MKLVLIFVLIAVAIAFVSGQQDCGPHADYSTCIPFPECQRSCYSLNPPGCEVPECDGNLTGCLCHEGYATDHQGYCVPYSHC